MGKSPRKALIQDEIPEPEVHWAPVQEFQSSHHD